MDFDLHTHTTYSDGAIMDMMASAAEKYGLKEVGFADHCNVSKRERMKTIKYGYGFNLDQTYERREKALKELRKRRDITIYSAVEMDYDPRDEEEIEAFLQENNFHYSLGSVHYLDGMNIHVEKYFARRTKKKRKKLVETYFDRLERMIELEIFDVASHIDLFERNQALQGLAKIEDYKRIAEAFKKSRTMPEINAGRALKGLKELHPTEEFRNILVEAGISFTAGTDSHAPEDIPQLNSHMDKRLQELGIAVERPAVLQS